MAGTLYVVGAPAGFASDLTRRAIRILGEVDLVVTDDRVHAQRLLDFHDITTNVVSARSVAARRAQPSLGTGGVVSRAVRGPSAPSAIHRAAVRVGPARSRPVGAAAVVRRTCGSPVSPRVVAAQRLLPGGPPLLLRPAEAAPAARGLASRAARPVLPRGSPHRRPMEVNEELGVPSRPTHI